MLREQANEACKNENLFAQFLHFQSSLHLLLGSPLSVAAGERETSVARMTARVLEQDPNHKRFKRTLFYSVKARLRKVCCFVFSH